MAKVAFSKLKCKINDTEMPIQIGEETIMVKQYLPIQEKLALMGRVVELAHDQDHNFSNPVKSAVIRDLEIVFAYTNLSFTDKQKEDFPKLYDQLFSSGILYQILNAIPIEEYQAIANGLNDSLEAIYKYQNSMLGIMDTIRTQYTNQEMDVEHLQKALNELQDTPLIKDILPLLGLE